MNSSQIIYEALKQKNYKQALLIALSNSLQIKLKTSVKTAHNTYSTTDKISLIQGTESHIDTEILGTEIEPIVNFHQQQVKDVYQTWDKNRETLLLAFELMSGGNINLEPLIMGDHNSSTQDVTPQYVGAIADSFDDLISEDDQIVSESELADFDDENSDEFTQIISPEDVITESDFDDDPVEENWVDDVIIQDSSPEQDLSKSMMEFEGEEFEQEDSNDDFLSPDNHGEEQDWGDLMEDQESQSFSQEATPETSEDDIDDWNEWIETQDSNEIPCNPEEIDWSEENWNDTPA